MSSDNLHKGIGVSPEQKIEESKYETPGEIYIDHGPPPPERYGVDKVRLLVQSPVTIAAQWELTGGLIGSVPGAGEDPQRLIRLTELAHNSARVYELNPFAQNWWFSVEPDTPYQAEIGVRANGDEVWLLRSNIVRTPRNAVSDEIDGEWMMLGEKFRQLLMRGGFNEKRYIEQHLGASMGKISTGMLSEALFSGSLVSGQNIYGSLSSMSFGARGQQ